jgi:hypothetical protein
MERRVEGEKEVEVVEALSSIFIDKEVLVIVRAGRVVRCLFLATDGASTGRDQIRLI